MPKRMKFVVEQWVLFMVRRQRGRHGDSKFSNRPVIFETNQDVEFESNLESSQVPNQSINLNSSDTARVLKYGNKLPSRHQRTCITFIG